MRQFSLFVSPLLAVAAVGGVCLAQDADPPSRVARIAYLVGPVSFEPASVDQWADASLNYPMTTGDNLYTEPGARAVLRIGQNSLRLNSTTNFQFVNLGDNIVQSSINSGSLSLRIRHLYDSESWEVDTPNGAITILRDGRYRVDTDPERNATMITVRAGDVEVTSNNQSFAVHSGQTAYIDNSGEPPDIQSASDPDDFDAFASSRDRIEDAPPPRYVSADMCGYEDLAANGDWRDTADGAVWFPRVAAGWTPYHDGHWAWVEPWGWTWIDDAPWGFAPFHYGRWALVDNRWGWYPGAVSARVYYAPALVAFVGGGGFSAGISIGGGGGGLVGWFPLGPREVYYPSYHVSPTYVRQVNVTNTRITNINVTNINVTNITYVNRSAVVAVPQNSFVSSQRVQQAAVRVDANHIRQAQVIGAAPQVAPRPESVLANSNGRRAAAPPPAIANRSVVAKQAPPPPPVPFAAKQQVLQQHPGVPAAPAQLQNLRTQAVQQHAAPARIQVQTVNTSQVKAVTPVVHTGPAPSLSQRPMQPRNHPGQPAAVPAIENRPAPNPAPRVQQPPPPARQTLPPPGRDQMQPPVRQQAPPVVRDEPRPEAHPATPPPPARQTPPPPGRDQMQPPVRQQAPPVVRDEPRPEAHPAPPPPPAREQVQPPVRQAPPPARDQVQPQPHPAPPPPREQAPPPPAREQVQPPARQAPPPPERRPPPKKDEKKTEEKKTEK